MPRKAWLFSGANSLVVPWGKNVRLMYHDVSLRCITTPPLPCQPPGCTIDVLPALSFSNGWESAEVSEESLPPFCLFWKYGR